MIYSVFHYRKYPDVFCQDVLGIKLNLYQRATMRAFFHRKYVMLIWSRGLSKSWIGALCLCVFSILYKNTRVGVIAPSFRQSKMIIKEKIIEDLMDRSDFLKNEITRDSVSTAEAYVEFANGSKIVAVPMGDGNKIRGYRFNVIMADEYAQIKKEIIDLVVNPMMNVKQGYEVGKEVYENEIGNRLLITSSAYYKHNHLYSTFLQYCDEVKRNNTKYYVSVLDYTVGLQVKLFDDDHIAKEKKRMSVLDFEMEYGAKFIDLSQDAWINPTDLYECSVLKKIERNGLPDKKYIMGVDVARTEGNDNTCIQILKLNIKKDYIQRDLVYTKALNGVRFSEQAGVVRELLGRFPCEKIYMDTTGLGVGLADELAKPVIDPDTLNTLPPLTDVNNAEHMRDIPEGNAIIVGIKFNSEINHHLGMSVKNSTQKRKLRMYSFEAGEDILNGEETHLDRESETLILEAEQTRRETMNIEAKPNGLYYKFNVPSRGSAKGRKDRWTALSLALYGADKYEDEIFRGETEDLCVGAIASRSMKYYG